MSDISRMQWVANGGGGVSTLIKGGLKTFVPKLPEIHSLVNMGGATLQSTIDSNIFIPL